MIRTTALALCYKASGKCQVLANHLCFHTYRTVMSIILSSLLFGLPISLCSTIPHSPSRYGQWAPIGDQSISNRENYNYNNHYNYYRVVTAVPTHILNKKIGPSIAPPTQEVTVGLRRNQFNPVGWMPHQKNHDKNELPEPQPRTDQEDGFKEKLGFSLSSLLPTSILNLPQAPTSSSENTADTEDDSNPYLDDSELLSSPQQSGDDNPALAPVLNTSSDEVQEASTDEDSSGTLSSSISSGLFSRLRNVIPFGNGIISGFLRSSENPNDDQAEAESSDTDSDVDTAFFSNDVNNEVNPGDSAVIRQSNPIPTDVISITNDAGNDIPEVENTIPRLPNPLNMLQNLLTSIRPPSPDPVSSLQSVGLTDVATAGVGSSGATGDSAVTALQSLADENTGLGGTLGTVIDALSTVSSSLGITENNAQWFILSGLYAGPMLATAIAASVIGIVYAAVYIPGVAIRNEDLEGEFWLLTFRQLYDILGIADPLEEFFDQFQFKFKRSGRAFGVSETGNDTTTLTIGRLKNEACVQRFTCEVIGRKFIGGRTSPKSWIRKGLVWVAEHCGGSSFPKPKPSPINNTTDILTSSNLLQIGKTLLRATATGLSSTSDGPQNNQIMESVTDISLTKNVDLPFHHDNHNSCIKYSCSPLTIIQSRHTNPIHNVPPNANFENSRLNSTSL